MPDRADGSVLIKAVVDADNAEKELNKLKKKISETERAIETAKSDRLPLAEKLGDVSAQLDQAKAKLHEMKNAAIGAFGKDQIAEQAETVRSIQNEFNKAASAVEKIDGQINSATKKLAQQKTEAGELVQKIESVSASTRAMARAQEEAQNSAKKFGLRIREVVRSALVFTLITQSLAKFREWMGAVIKTNEEANASVARLKGALLTLAQPLVDILVPAFITLVDLLTSIVGKLAQFTALLGGTTVSDAAKAAESLNKEAEAIENTGKAAKKSGSMLASFDEINKLSSTESTGGSSGADIKPDFSMPAGISDQLSKIATDVLAIAAGFALWKLSDSLPGNLGLIGTSIAGLVITVGGLKLLWDGLNDAWENGIDWGNFATMIAGLATSVLGLNLAFGQTGASIGLLVGGIALLVTGFQDIAQNGVTWENLATVIAGVVGVALGLFGVFGQVGGAVGLLVGGIALLVTGFQDVFNNGFTLQNTLMSIAGIFATGLGISLLTGNLIPALIGGIGGILLAVTVLTGNGGQLIGNLRQILEGLSKFITGAMTGDIKGAFSGLLTSGKGIINTLLTLFGSLLKALASGLNWLVDKINSIKFTVPDWVPLIGGKSVGFNLKRIKTDWKIPQLAQGAVIPPNREFLAVLGDQKSGTNIEAPASLIKQMVSEALRENGRAGGGTFKFEIYLNGRKMAVEMVKEVNDMTREAGTPVLLF